MKSIYQAALVVTAFAVAPGCSCEDCFGDSSTSSTGPLAVDGGPQPEEPNPELKAFVPTRYVAEVPGGCAEAVAARNAGFNVKPVFPDLGDKLPPSMKNLCSFEWAGNTAPTPADRERLTATGVTVPDVPLVVALANRSAEWPRQARERRQATLVMSGLIQEAVPPTRVSLPPLKAGALPVMIGIPDSSPTSTSDDIIAGQNPHGYNVAWAAKFLSCTDENATQCLSAVRTELALAYTSPPDGVMTQPDPKGGTYGTRSALAAAIRALANRYVQEKNAGKVSNLVINISVGWEPLADCVPAKDVKGQKDTADGCPVGMTYGFNPANKSVLDALDYASCNGALIIAAAGNDPGLSWTPTGPMLPAAWEGLAAPGSAYCACAFSPQGGSCEGVDRASGSEAPLLHAVGGVTAADVPILVSRPNSTPRLVAPASLILGFPGREVVAADPHYALTGTSMAAAITSAAAASAWAQAPNLRAEDIARNVWATGAPLGQTADFCLARPVGESGGACDEVHRVAVCAAVKETVGTGATFTCPPATSRRPATYAPVAVTPKTPTGTDLANLLGLTYGQPIVPVCPECSLVPDAAGQYVSTPESVLYDSWFYTNQVFKVGYVKLTLTSADGREIPFTANKLPGVLKPSSPSPGTATQAVNIDINATGFQTATLQWQLVYTNGTKTTVSEELLVR